MDLELSHSDYTAVGLTLPNTLKILPNLAPKPSLKVAVGDQDGVLQVFSIKNDEIQLTFKTLPGEPITSVHLGGSSPGSSADKIFISCGAEVRGYTKKGKLFLALETNLSEPIIAMWVREADLLVAGSHCLSHYRDCKEVGSYLCGDTIVDLAAIHIANSTRIVGVVACSGGAVRAVERGRALGGARLPQGPRVLCPLPQGPRPSPHLLCGADDGTLHLLQLDREHGGIIVQQFEGVESGEGVCAMGWWEGGTAGGGHPLLLLARSDGSLNIYRISPDDPQQSALLLFTHCCGESVTSVWGNAMGIIAVTRAGRVLGLGAPTHPDNATAKLNALRNEVQELENKVEKERSRYRTSTQPLSQGLSAIPALQIGEEWGPVEGDGARRLCLSLGAPLDTLLLQSSAPLKLYDAAMNTALLTRACDPQNSAGLLATYRCQTNTQRLEMRVGAAAEGAGAAGLLRLYLTPLLQPKCTQLLMHNVPPLSWHVPSQDVSQDGEFNSLGVSGAFSKAELHSWLVRLLPDVPARPPPSMDSLAYRSIITNTALHCSYRKGEAEFKSENVSTIAIIKDFLSLEATKKKVRLDILCNVVDETLISTLLKLHPKMAESFQRMKDEKLLEALRELEVNSTDEFLEEQLCKDYTELLRNPPSTTGTKRLLSLSQLHDIITNLYIDRNRLKGINIKNKLPELKTLLENYDLEEVLLFFNKSFT